MYSEVCLLFVLMDAYLLWVCKIPYCDELWRMGDLKDFLVVL